MPSAAEPGLPVLRSSIPGNLGDQGGKGNGNIQNFDVSFLSPASSFFASYIAVVLPVDPTMYI